MNLKRFGLTALALIAAVSLAAPAYSADAYPSKGDVRVIIPKNPGGGTDVSTRTVTQFMKKYAPGINFVPVNRPDGGGVTGMVETAKAKPDGYTLGAVTVELAMFPHQGKSSVTYADFDPIVAQIAAPAALIVPAKAPYNTLEEFVAYVKANPNTVQMGNSGMGAIWHAATRSFEKAFDVKVKHIPYPNGTADIVAALLGGHIDGTLADPSGLKSQYESGAVKILGVMADERSMIFPNVPTFKEMGHDMAIRAWAAVVAPKNTPKDVLAYLRDAAAKATKDPEYQQMLMKQGIDPVSIIGDDVTKMMAADHKMFEDMLKK